MDTNTLEQVIIHCLNASFMMLWATFWSLILGLMLSAIIQVAVPKEKIAKWLGRAGVKELAVATLSGAASSSCSYAAVAMGKTLFQKGASLSAVLAFMFASTNLVAELSIVLWNLLGPVFVLAEFVGGILLVSVIALIVKVSCPKQLVESARKNHGQPMTHEHKGSTASPVGNGFSPAALASRQLRWEFVTAVAQAFANDLRMLSKEVLIGFLIAGFISVTVPMSVWQTLFIKTGPAWLQIIENAMVGPVIAIASFVCSIGNIPMAAVLWKNGISFGGVISFIFADLLVLPILSLYKKYYGMSLAIYISVAMYVTMVLCGIMVDLLFSALGIIPPHVTAINFEHMSITFNYTFCLNVLFSLTAVVLNRIARLAATAEQAPSCCQGH